MRYLIYLIFLTISLASATLTLNEARDQSSNFSILHINDNSPFNCREKLEVDFTNIIICQFSQDITPQILRSNRDLQIESDKNNIKIIPTLKYLLRGIQDDFITSNIVKNSSKAKFKHWIIVAYKKDMDIFKSNNSNGINFDITYSEDMYPSVGTLNIDGLPVLAKNDAVVMDRIKTRFEEQKYDLVISLADKLIVDDDTFIEEANLYKLRSLDRLAWEKDNKENKKDKDKIMELAKSWIQNNPSSKYIPEILMIMSKTNYKLGYDKIGDEYSDILNEEFYDNKFNQIAQLHKADSINRNSKIRDESIKIYKDVLYNTKELDIASKASMKLSNAYMNKGHVNKANSYIEKVMAANKSYISKDIKQSYEIAKKFADYKRYDIAIKIATELLSSSNEQYMDGISKDLAYWHDLDGKKNLAYGKYKQYLNDFQDGNSIDFVKSRIDKILVDLEELNSTKKLADLDKIMLKYPNDSIYKKALIQKAKIYILGDRYKELFDMKDDLSLSGGKEVLQIGANKKIALDLDNDNCKSAILLSNDYNITIKQNQEKKFFECLMRFAKYKQALTISKKYTSSKELHKKLFWMYKTLKVYNKLGYDKKVIMLGEDIEKLSKILKLDVYADIAYEKATAYFNLKEYDSLLLKEAQKIQELFEGDVRNIDLFAKVLRDAKNRKNHQIAVIYTKKIINLQNRYKMSDYSPQVELDLITALKYLKQYDEALKEDIKLLYKKLTDKQKANVLYIAGELSLKLNKTKQAKEFFIKCGEIVNDNSWQKLCVQSLKLL